MEKIRHILAWIIGNRFWLTCAFTAIGSLSVWYLALNAIEAQRRFQVTKITSNKASVDQVLTTNADVGSDEIIVDAHPNEGTQVEMEKRIRQAAESALAAWQVRYDQQKDILVFAEAIPEHIRTVLANHLPMEKTFERELVEATPRATFREFFVRHMVGLARNTINATWNYDEKGIKLSEAPVSKAGEKPEAAVAVPKQEDLVFWVEENQELWHSKVTEFMGFDDNRESSEVPNSQQMLALQQDVWVLEAVLKMIAKVNEGYVANDLAPIKRLDHVLVGKDAMAAIPVVLDPVDYKPEGNKNASAPIKSSRGDRTKNTADSSLAATKGDAFNPSSSSSPFHGRYVDRDYTQLNKSEIERILTDSTLSDRSYLAVAKRIPVRVAVKMDERRISEFLAAAANSPFTFEIRSLRINKHIPNAGVRREKSKGGGGKSDGSRPEDLGKGGVGGGGGLFNDDAPGGSSGGSSGGTKDPEFIPEMRKTFDVRVEFNGIVKIYNPPDRKLFFPEDNASTDGNVPTEPVPENAASVPAGSAENK